MNLPHPYLHRQFFIYLGLFISLIMSNSVVHGQCCCSVCPDGVPVEQPDMDCVGEEPCDPTQCPECQTAIPLTDHLWILAVLGAAGGAWLLLRNRTAEEVA